MRITGFIWLADIIQKLWRKHGVDQDEVEELFVNQPRFRFVETGYHPGEDVYAACGQTSAGRYLICFFIHKRDGRALPLSARDMTRRERRRYEKK
ncbi:MAG TPA: BrnT family toxin [Pyrinomonadaceae bacterium]